MIDDYINSQILIFGQLTDFGLDLYMDEYIIQDLNGEYVETRKMED